MWDNKAFILDDHPQIINDEGKFNDTCLVCKSPDIEKEECLGPPHGKGFKKAYTGSCNECFAGFEVISGKVAQIREGRL